jgi:hypothetical protein
MVLCHNSLGEDLLAAFTNYIDNTKMNSATRPLFLILHYHNRFYGLNFIVRTACQRLVTK